MSTDHDHLDTIIHNYWEDIVSTVGAEHVIPNLRRVINAEEAEEVQNQSRFPTRRSRTNYLLDLLEKRSDGWTHFVIALRNLYPSLYTKIVDDYVKVFTRQQTGHVLEDHPANPDRNSEYSCLLIHLLRDLEEKLEKSEANLEKERVEHAVTREACQVTLRERSEAQRDIEMADTDCQKFQQQLAACQEQLAYHQSGHADMICARNAALQMRDEVQDMLRSKITEVHQLQTDLQILEDEKRDSLRRLSLAEACNSQSNTEIQAEHFKQQLVEQQRLVLDLQLQVAKLKDRLNKKSLLLNGSGDLDRDSESPVFCRNNSTFGSAITDQSSVYLVELDCSASSHGIEVSGTAIVDKIMCDSPAYQQGLVHEGDTIMKVNDVDIESRLSAFANDLMRSSGIVQLQIGRPLLGSVLSRHLSGASRTSMGALSQRKLSRGSSVSQSASFSAYYSGGKQCFRQYHEYDVGVHTSRSLHSLPEATLSSAMEPHATRRTSFCKNGIMLTRLNRDNSPENLSRSLTAVHEPCCDSETYQQLTSTPAWSTGSRRGQNCTSANNGTSSPLKNRRSGLLTCQGAKSDALGTIPTAGLEPNFPVSTTTKECPKSEGDLINHLDIKHTASNIERSVVVGESGFHPAIQIVGGLGRGIFVTGVTGNVIHGDLNEGDQIIKLNDENFVDVTHAQAVQAIATEGKLTAEVVYNLSGYGDVIDCNFGNQDSFYVKALFTYNSHGPYEHGFDSGTVFHVVRTLVPDQNDCWVAYTVNRSGNDTNSEKMLPSLSKAAELHRTAASVSEPTKIIRGVLTGWKRHSLKRKATAAAADTIEQGSEFDRTQWGYEFVKQCKVVTARPVMLLGVLTVPISEQLLESHTPQFIKCKLSSITRISHLASNELYCIVESDPGCISKLHEQHLHPIVIFITTKSRKHSKSFLPSGVSRHELESQIDAAETMKKHYGHEFSAHVTITSLVDLTETVRSIIRIVEDQQENIVWDVNNLEYTT